MSKLLDINIALGDNGVTLGQSDLKNDQKDKTMSEPDSHLKSRLFTNLTAEYKKQGWTQARLAEKIGCGRTSLCKMLHSSQDMPATLLYKIAQILSVSLDTLFGLEPPNDPFQHWLPWQHDAGTLLDRFAEEEEHAEFFETTDVLLAYPRMTEDVQGQLNLSRYGTIAITPRGSAWLEAYENWGKSRLSSYLQKDKYSLPKTTTYMRKRDFERLVFSKPPYDLCSRQQVLACLQHVKKQCVIERGFRLILIDDHRLDEQLDLAMELLPLEALAVIGRNYGFRKYPDTSVVQTVNKIEISNTRRTFRRLNALAIHGGEEKDIIRQLDFYLRVVENLPTTVKSDKPSN